jgi:hypothetical protein
MDKANLIPVITAEELHQKMANGRHSSRISVYMGSRDDNLKMENVRSFHDRDIVVTSPVWKNSDRRAKLHETIRELRYRLENQRREMEASGIVQNANQGYDAQSIAQLVSAYFIDIRRLSDEMADYTGILTTEHVRPDMPKDINLRDFLPWTGKEKIIEGSNDSVPLIQQNKAEVVPLSLVIKAFGHKNSLFDVVFNPFWEINTLMETVANIRVDSRNNDVIGSIVKHSFDAAHTQEPDQVSDTYDLRIYETVDRAIDKLKNLYHPQFKNRKIGNMNPKVYMLINSMNRRKVQPVISGGLVGAGGLRQIVSALPVDGIIEYDGGIQDGLPWGKEVLSFPGVQEGEFYLIAVTPFGGMTFTKRDLTLETGVGSVLQLSREERAWYRIGTTFLYWLLGKTEGTGSNAKAYGAIIKGTLPDRDKA